MTASMLLARLRSAGVALWIEEWDGELFVIGVPAERRRVSDTEVDLLRTHKAEVVRLLKEQRSYSLASRYPLDSTWGCSPAQARLASSLHNRLVGKRVDTDSVFEQAKKEQPTMP